MAKIIELTRGHVAIVDDEDFEKLNLSEWYYGEGYAKRREWCGDCCSHIVRMHRVILDAPDGVDVDHINGNGLDNRRCNLRLASKGQNMANQRVQSKREKASKYKGVSLTVNTYVKRDGTIAQKKKPWRAYVVKNNRQYGLGQYDTELEAARAYDAKARELFGEFANLNFPDPI